MARKNALRVRKVTTISGAGLAVVELDRVESWQIVCYQRVAWELNKATSGGNTRCRLYISTSGYKHYISEQDGPAADTLYWDADPVWLGPGESLGLEVDQAQASTKVEIEATGYYSDAGEGVL